MNRIEDIQGLYEKVRFFTDKDNRDDIDENANHERFTNNQAFILVLHESWPLVKRVLDEARMTADTLQCVQSALRDVRLVYNEHEDTLKGSGMKHDLINLWNCSEYIEGLSKALEALTSAPGSGDQDAV